MSSQNVVSPIPGVFYRKPAPDQDVYVNEGDAVKTGDVIGLVEVMKNFYEVKAEVDGVLKEFLVEDQTMLEAGQDIAVIE
ncbi:MAG TPA: biotin carboxyl carrier domain-containing protein [Candidatus Pseudogracilibacillus intestinigallinarum]|uniref:Biotin carboxyl carrier protein of acetyl-CoA carboxylase n=1 Tax=Candidatus Pseudogracilibacillus intestinigallinarum TaxID=2838742 RepID=A0A9D1TJM7_9BACI|nr:biotin carboxyl carrier domain-containing protein [Candidatus Pseudogracilibacillus intestinigallinarum]